MYIVIAGAGLVGTGLARRLIESRHDVVVIDQDRAVCERIASGLGGASRRRPRLPGGRAPQPPKGLQVPGPQERQKSS